jgi:Tat protein secretion system quality control protein TatD with DNase activity
VRLVAERLAALREMALEDMAAVVWENASEVFGLRDAVSLVGAQA